MNNEIQFDMEAAIQALRQGKDLSGKDGVLPPLDQTAKIPAIPASCLAGAIERALPSAAAGEILRPQSYLPFPSVFLRSLFPCLFPLLPGRPDICHDATKFQVLYS